jgi:hypothetical protein
MKITSFFLLLCAVTCANTVLGQNSKPDLIVSYVKITSVDTSLGTFSCDFSIKNIGTTPVNLDETRVTFTGFMSNDDRWDNSDSRIHGIMYVNGLLKPGQATPIRRFESRTGVGNDGYLLFVVDPYKKVTESNEKNNHLAKKRPLTVGQ